MTKEEARNYLLKWIEYATNPDPFIDVPCPDEEILEAMRIGAEALSNTESPSNLDEVAEQYALDVKAKPYGELVKAAFKGGSKWEAGQGVTVKGLLYGGSLGIPDIPEEFYTDKEEEVIVQIRKK